MNDNAELIRRLFQAFGEGDLPAIRAALATDVESITPGTSKLAGTARGPEEVLRQLGRSRELSDGTYRIAVQDVLGGDRHAAAIYRGTGERKGRRLDLLHLALYEVDSGRITRIRFLPFDQDAFDAFWS